MPLLFRVRTGHTDCIGPAEGSLFQAASCAWSRPFVSGCQRRRGLPPTPVSYSGRLGIPTRARSPHSSPRGGRPTPPPALEPKRGHDSKAEQARGPGPLRPASAPGPRASTPSHASGRVAASGPRPATECRRPGHCYHDGHPGPGPQLEDRPSAALPGRQAGSAVRGPGLLSRSQAH